MNRLFSIIFCICIALFCVALGLYFSQFNGGFSFLQEDFGTFGDYLNPFLTLISIILIGYISFRANEITESFNKLQLDISSRSNSISESFNKIQLQPQLFLITSILPGSKIQDDESWIIKNAYEAPAINILVRMKFNRNVDKSTKWVNCFSLERDSAIEILWLKHCDVIELLWTNISQTASYKIVYKEWRGIVEDATFEEYNEALNEAKEHGLTNSFLNRDFINFININNIDVSRLDLNRYKVYFLDNRKLQ